MGSFVYFLGRPERRDPLPFSPFRRILILADIEGSSGCGSYRASSFLRRSWAKACVEMSRDVDAVVKGLFAAGVEKVTVKDFIGLPTICLPKAIDQRARLVSGLPVGPRTRHRRSR
jgi:D-amino peptidase